MTFEQRIENSKKWVQRICRFTYILGFGDFWYEEKSTGSKFNKFYSVYLFLMMTWCSIMILFLESGIFKEGLTKEERHYAIIFGFAQCMYYGKNVNNIIKKEKIKKLLHVMFEQTKQLFVDEETERVQMKKAKRYSYSMSFFILMCLNLLFIDAIYKAYKNGEPISAASGYYPHNDDISWQAYFIRALMHFYLLYFILVNCANDCLVLTILVYLEFQFKTLQLYFKSLKDAFVRNDFGKSQIELEKEMNRGFAAGIKLHSDTVWCARTIQSCLGNVYSFHIAMCYITLAMTLLNFAGAVDRSLAKLLSMFMNICCTLIVLSAYTWTGGQITYEASLVGDAMFHSGWHLCSARAGMRTLLVRGIQQSQVPVVMAAFGVLELSYENFIAIVKQSYSLFTIFY